MREIPLPTLPLADFGATALSRRSLHGRDQDMEDAVRLRARFDVTWVRHLDEVREAERPRYVVFAEEMDASLSVPAGSPAGHDIDMYSRSTSNSGRSAIALRQA